MPRLVEQFAGLCREAGQFNATIGFEVMGCAMLDNLPGRHHAGGIGWPRNGGLIIDIYQVVHQGWTFEQIKRIPLKYLLGVELNDGMLPGSPDEDPGGRKFCGEGQYDIRGLIQCVQGMGYQGPWAVEVMSERLAVLPLESVARRAFDTSMAEFGREESRA